MSSSTFCVCACVVVLVAVVATSEGVEPCGRHKRDIMTSIFNEPADFYETGRQRRHLPSDLSYHHSAHHHHHHSLNKPFPSYGVSLGRTPKEIDNTPRSMPTDFMKQLNGIETMEDFMKHVVRGNTAISNRFGEDSNNDPLEGDPNIPMAVSAKCKLEEVTVPLDIPNFNPNYFYFPTCTRVKRCGGCCTNTVTSCQPTRTENITMKIMETEYKEDNEMLAVMKKVVVQVVNHTDCKCDCTIKPKDCITSLQEYRKNECRCACTNVAEMRRCEAENDTKVWDHNTCHCSCREEKRCSTGRVFHAQNCSCILIPRARRRQTRSIDDTHHKP